MLNRKESKIITVGIISFAVVALIGLVYAAFTGQLNITGKSVGRHSKWDIHFQNVSTITTNGTSKVLNNSQPTINENNPTQIENYDVSFTTPGDSISFTFDVVNDGNYDALITSVDVDTPKCDVNGDQTDTSAVNMCKYLDYKITYDGGAEINQNSDIVYAKDKVKLKVTLTYKEFSDDSELPTEDVNISNLGIQVGFEQNNGAEVDDSGVVRNNKVYRIGEKITLNNEYYYVIATSGAGKDYVTVLKEEELTPLEINLYGGSGTENNHLNKNVLDSSARGHYAYLGVVYYSSETCGYTISGDSSSLVTTGCITDYSESDIKYIVDAWAKAKFQNNELKTIDGYSARLLRTDEYNAIPSSMEWRRPSDDKYYYWAMDFYNGVKVYSIDYRYQSPKERTIYDDRAEIRPVVNVYKSALETQ